MKDLETINTWFRKAGGKIITLRWYMIIAFVVVDLLAIWGILDVKIDSSNKSWFLENDPLMVTTREFEAHFGNDEFVPLLIEAENVFTPEILSVIRELSQELGERVPFAGRVTSLTHFEFTRGTGDGVEIEDLVPPDIPLDREAVERIRESAFSKKFLVNRLFSEDAKQAWIALQLQSYPDDFGDEQEEPPAIQVGKEVIAILQQAKYAPYSIHIAGGPPVVYEEQLFFSREATRLMSLACLAAVLILFGFLRSPAGIVVPMLTGISAVLWTFGGMGCLGITIDSMVATVPIFLGLAVSIGYSIHIFNFFQRRFSATGKRHDSLVYAVQETGWPIFFTAVTTISALLAFYFVPIRQVRWMGLSSAAVVFATYLLVMTLTPAFLSFGKDAPLLSKTNSHREKRLETAFAALSSWILHHTRVIMVAFFMLVLIAAGGLPSIRVSIDHKKTFGLKIPYVRRLDYVGHTQIGSMHSYNLMLTFREADAVKAPEILKAFEVLDAEVKKFPYVKRVSSLLELVKDMNQVLHGDDPDYYRIPSDRAFISQLMLLYEMSGGTEQERWVNFDYTSLRMQVEVSDFNTGQVEREFKWLQKRAKELFPQASFAMVGGLVEVSLVQSYIARGEIVSFLIALVVIGILMMLVLQSPLTGLIAMIPNVTPAIVVGGVLGYFDIPLDMTMMVIIPMLLGLAVDDTIHFITHCKLEFQRSGNYRIAIEKTFKTVGKAIFMTSFILVATFSVYMTSIANLFIHLCLMAVIGIVSALLADYFITPILLVWSKAFGEEE